MPACSICNHRERDAIDRAIFAGKSQHQLAKIFNVGRHSILRHSKHLPAIVAKSNEATLLAHSDDLVGQIANLEEDAKNVQQKAGESGDHRVVLAAIRERTRLLELRAKIVGEIRPSQVNILNLNVDEETAKRAMHAYLAKSHRSELAS
jgi:hypothetical protein